MAWRGGGKQRQPKKSGPKTQGTVVARSWHGFTQHSERGVWVYELLFVAGPPWWEVKGTGLDLPK